jgi:hypothetical protein
MDFMMSGRKTAPPRGTNSDKMALGGPHSWGKTSKKQSSEKIVSPAPRLSRLLTGASVIAKLCACVSEEQGTGRVRTQIRYEYLTYH